MNLRERAIFAAGGLLLKDFQARALAFGAGPVRPLEKFNSVLSAARAADPAYDAACSAAGVGPGGAASLAEIKNLPVLDRAALAARPAAAPALARLESGGTGRSGRVETPLDLRAVTGRYAALLSVLKTAGWRMGDATAALHPVEYGYFQNFGKALKAGAFPKLAFEFFQQYLLYRLFHNRVNVYYGPGIFTSQEEARRLLAGALALDPVLLITRPDALMALLRVLDGTRSPFKRLKAVLTVGTALGAAVRAEAGLKLGADVFNLYASTELGYIALGCPASGDWLHVDEAGYLLENDPERGLLVTDFNNGAARMIRYETGDCAETSSAPCPCGRSGLRLKPGGRLRAFITDAKGGRLRETAIIDRAAAAGLPFFQLMPGTGGLDLFLPPGLAGREAQYAAAVEAALGLGRGGIARARASGFSMPPSGKFCFLP